MNNTRSLVQQIPNVNYSDSGLLFANTITMHGVGLSSALIFPLVNYDVDGIPIPTRIFDMPFGDVEKIDISRDPQGTTGGLNSQAGSVNIVTRAPCPVAMGNTGLVLVLMDARKIICPMKGQSTDK